MPELLPIEIIRALYASAHVGYMNCMVGNPAPIVADRGARCTKPKPGDMVIEVSCGPRYWNSEELRSCIGWLIATEPGMWENEEGDQEQYCTYRHICTLDGEILTWSNSSLVAVPTHWRWPEKGDPR